VKGIQRGGKQSRTAARALQSLLSAALALLLHAYAYATTAYTYMQDTNSFYTQPTTHAGGEEAHHAAAATGAILD